MLNSLPSSSYKNAFILTAIYSAATYAEMKFKNLEKINTLQLFVSGICITASSLRVCGLNNFQNKQLFLGVTACSTALCSYCVLKMKNSEGKTLLSDALNSKAPFTLLSICINISAIAGNICGAAAVGVSKIPSMVR